MKLVVPSLRIDETDGFKNDLFARGEFGEALASLVQASDDELVIALNGKWGEGKTTFVKMWCGYLRNQNVPTIYIDSFKCDYIDDPFIAVAGAISAFIENECEGEIAFREYIDKAKRVGATLAGWAGKVGLKALTLGAVRDADIDGLKDVADDIAAGASGALGEVIKRQLKSHAAREALFEDFKALLSEIPSRVPGNTGNKIVVIIDELDRCRPTFAIELLERIKHIFSVKNVVFVLVMNRFQLTESIKSVYGSSVDAHGYLQKFINLETEIPRKGNVRTGGNHRAYAGWLLREHKIQCWGNESVVIDVVTALSEFFDLSLRNLERVFTNISIFYGAVQKNHLRLEPLMCLISTLKVVKPEVFSALTKGAIRYKDIAREIGYSPESVVREQRALHVSMNWLRYSLMTDEEFKSLSPDDELRSYGQVLFNYATEPNGLVPYFCRVLSMFRVE